jgi:LacI family transcriptional regulator
VPVTIHDVAREARVSHTTVSRALNNKGELSPETRARILAVAERLHYVPSSVARALASGATGTLGLIITNSASPVYAEVVRAIEGAAHAAGLGLLLCNSAGSQEQALRCLDMLQSRQVDGLILAPAQTDQRDIAMLQRSGIPFVLLLRHFPDLPTDYVIMDNVAAGYQMTSHLLQLGHRRIGHVAGPEHISSGQGRLTGYRRALAEYGVPYRADLVCYQPFTMPGGYEAGQQLLPQLEGRPTAVFGATDMQAVGVLKAAKELGLAVPEQVALAGGDDIELAEYLEVPLTSFRQPAGEIGAAVVEILTARIKGDRGGPRQVVLPPQLIIRKSSGPHL